MLIDIVVYRGIDETDAVGPLEVFRSAGKGGIDVTARLVTRRPEDVVVCSYGLRVLPDAVYRPGEADVLLVAGGGWSTRAEVGAWAEVQQGGWLPLLLGSSSGNSVAIVPTGSPTAWNIRDFAQHGDPMTQWPSPDPVAEPFTSVRFPHQPLVVNNERGSGR